MIGEKKKPPLSGREGGSRGRKEGEDCVSAASSAAPSEASASERKSPIPGGGSSWFVLLTEEKNEQKAPWISCQAGNDNTLKFCEMPGARLLEATYAGIWGARLRRTARHTSA